MSIVHNPILRGFNPDPSILRVGDDYYIATSTFEWFPAHLCGRPIGSGEGYCVLGRETALQSVYFDDEDGSV